MNSIYIENVPPWPLWRKVLFRFFFIYILFPIIPWLLSIYPVIRSVKRYYEFVISKFVNWSNTHLFHIKKTLVLMLRNRDTSFAWAQQYFFLLLALIGCIIWSLLDSKRRNYFALNYWLSLGIRYCLAVVAFNYGFEKVFGLQIPFPTQSQLSTPLGNFLPMRLYWVSTGYSTVYQIFAGATEVLTGILLIYRKTVTFGSLMGFAVFTNIMIINIGYDIPVKLFSSMLSILCLYLIISDYNRIANFLFLNKPAAGSKAFQFFYTNKWIKIARLALKFGFIMIFAVSFFSQWRMYKIISFKTRTMPPIKLGVYDVTVFTLNNDTLPLSHNNTIRWNDVIFDSKDAGSIGTDDTLLRQRYRRGYFTFNLDTVNHVINFRKGDTDSAMYNGIIFSLNYEMPDSNTLKLWGLKQQDSIYLLIERNGRQFPLAERQFHWLTEYSR